MLNNICECICNIHKVSLSRSAIGSSYNKGVSTRYELLLLLKLTRMFGIKCWLCTFFLLRSKPKSDCLLEKQARFRDANITNSAAVVKQMKNNENSFQKQKQVRFEQGFVEITNCISTIVTFQDICVNNSFKEL